MKFLGVLLLVGSSLGTPTAPVLPVYEPAAPIPDLPTWCAEDCPQHVLDNPVLLVSRDAEGADRYTVASSPPGLNGLPNRSALEKAAAIAVFPLERFPFDKFPGLKDSEVHIPQHKAKVEALLVYRQAPVIVLLGEGEAARLSEALGLVHAADLALGPEGVKVAQDYGRVARRHRGLGDIVSSAAGAAESHKNDLGFAKGSVPLVLVQCS